MTYVELFARLSALLPFESWCIDCETWRHSLGSGSDPTVHVKWKIWLANDRESFEAPTSQEALDKVVVWLSTGRKAPLAAGVPNEVEAVGLVPLAIAGSITDRAPAPIVDDGEHDPACPPTAPNGEPWGDEGEPEREPIDDGPAF